LNITFRGWPKERGSASEALAEVAGDDMELVVCAITGYTITKDDIEKAIIIATPIDP
jgi:hypothetical protein